MIDKNEIVLSGTIENLPKRAVRKRDGMSIKFDLKVYRKPKNVNAESKFDIFKIAVINDDNFLSTYKDGDRLIVRGFLNAINYTDDQYAVNENVKNTIKNYIELFEKFPCKEEPKDNRREIIDWPEIINAGLIGDVPKDSLFRSSTEKIGVPRKDYVYKVDKDKHVYKETQHVAYEVGALSYKMLDKPLDSTKGDLNKATLIGKIIKMYTFNPNVGIPLTNLNIQTQTEVFSKTRMLYNNAIVWNNRDLSRTKDLNVDDYIYLFGRLQSREYQKELTFKPTGNNRRKIIKNYRVVEISVSKINKIKI